MTTFHVEHTQQSRAKNTCNFEDLYSIHFYGTKLKSFCYFSLSFEVSYHVSLPITHQIYIKTLYPPRSIHTVTFRIRKKRSNIFKMRSIVFRLRDELYASIHIIPMKYNGVAFHFSLFFKKHLNIHLFSSHMILTFFQCIIFLFS